MSLKIYTFLLLFILVYGCRDENSIPVDNNIRQYFSYTNNTDSLNITVDVFGTTLSMTDSIYQFNTMRDSVKVSSHVTSYISGSGAFFLMNNNDTLYIKRFDSISSFGEVIVPQRPNSFSYFLQNYAGTFSITVSPVR